MTLESHTRQISGMQSTGTTTTSSERHVALISVVVHLENHGVILQTFLQF